MNKPRNHSDSNHLMVIGNGMAGTAFLEEIVQKKNRPSVTVFGEEPCNAYNRILLSDVLACAKSFDETHLNARSWYEEHDIRLRTGAPVIRISPDRKEIVTRDGQSHHYDRLLIATGSIPAIPPIRGLDRRGIFTFRNIEDTESMIRWASSRYRAVVIGGGLLGLEAARGLTNRGMFVTVVHLMGHLMDQQVDERAGAILKSEIEKMGIQIRLGCTVEEISGDGVVEQVRLTTGETIPADLVLITTGIRPNTQLAKEAGLAVNRGILVDDAMQTSNPDIFAVGECIEHHGRTYGLVGPVLEQAKIAAAIIAGSEEAAYHGSILSTALKVAGIQLTSMGDFRGKEEGSEELIYMDGGAATYKKLVIRDNRVIGAIFLGDDGGSREVR
ncbi:MAG: NAD(P)/FAD-dependent oxidoreductase, partial [Nitrospirae bacterium]|nr:NAD(P)/FAD-dependent oxidoreductase [Nitrospirota bacterium]